MPMRPGGEVLQLLRARPGIAVRAWGFKVVGGSTIGTCTVTCQQYRTSSIYQLTVTPGGTDWFYPFESSAAGSCLVPFDQPAGTLVLTGPMNGCALEVHEERNGNRFYHDADGTALDALQPNRPRPKIRVAYADYMGPERYAHQRFLRYHQRGDFGGYANTVIVVKLDDSRWGVYGSTFIQVNQDFWQIKDRVPYELGTFEDNIARRMLREQLARDQQRDRNLFPLNEAPL